MDDTPCNTLLEETYSSTFHPFNEEAVRALENNMLLADQEILKIKEGIRGEEIPEETSINYILLTFYKKRNKRILRTYLLSRLFRAEHCDLLTTKERETLKQIQRIEDDYLKTFNLNYEGKAPLLSFIKIITLKDCGLVLEGDELLDLKKGRIYFVKRKTVEHLLEGGFIKVMEM